ncbi:hypothetical protein ABZT02_14190 [Streptomyces sp. NPDC005402]
MTNLWYVKDDTFLGRLSIRHRLTPHLLELGGGRPAPLPSTGHRPGPGHL